MGYRAAYANGDCVSSMPARDREDALAMALSWEHMGFHAWARDPEDVVFYDSDNGEG